MQDVTESADGAQAISGLGLYRVEEVAELLRCHHKTVRKLLSDGQLRRVDIGGHAIRVTEGSVREFIATGGSTE